MKVQGSMESSPSNHEQDYKNNDDQHVPINFIILHKNVFNKSHLIDQIKGRKKYQEYNIRKQSYITQYKKAIFKRIFKSNMRKKKTSSKAIQIENELKSNILKKQYEKAKRKY